MRWFNGFWAVLFLGSALVQFNDPDPVRWMLLYVAAAALSLAWGRFVWARPLAGFLCLLTLVWAVWICFQLPVKVDFGASFGDWNMKVPGSELVRELGGLSLVMCWMGVLFRRRVDKAGD